MDPTLKPFMIGCGALMGAIMGSFISTFAIRYAREEQALSGRSYCDYCHHPLNWAETLPVVSYLNLRGKCAHCKQSIDSTHVAIEALGALLVGLALATLSLIPALALILLGFLLITQGLIDLKTYRLPDAGTVAIAIVALSLAIYNHMWLEGVMAALMSGLVLSLLKYSLEARHGKLMLGLGDIKLISALALWIGILLPFMMLFACMVALIQKLIFRSEQEEHIAFGPAIAVSGLVFSFIRLAYPELSL